MDPNPVRRRLTCILAADAVGYSRLMSEDEAETLRVLAAHRSVIDGIIAFHEGRIVNTAGDSVLAEFGSAVEAVRCAVEIQDALRTRNESLPEARRMLFRVGVNLGDVVVKGTDLLGDGVNIAARLEGIAPPGGIVIASSVYDQITGKLDLGFHDIGEQTLKNITHPVRAFTVSGAGGTVRAAVPTRGAPSRRPWLLGGAAALFVVLAVVGWRIGAPGTSPDRPAAGATAPPAAAAPGSDDERAKLKAEVAAAEQARADAEARARAADAEASRERAEREAAALKAKAQAEAAATKAKAEAEAALLRSKAQAETQVALEKTKAADEIAARAARDAAAARDNAQADSAAQKASPAGAATAAATAPAPHFDASVFDGAWTATLACDSVDELPEGRQTIPAKVAGGLFTIDWPVPGMNSGGHAEGRPGGDGSLTLRGSSTSRTKRSFGKAISVRFDGSLKDQRFDLRGHIGQRNCTLLLARAG